MKTLFNLLGYQAVWFAAVIGAGNGETWPALLACALFAATQVPTSPRPAVALRLLAVAIAVGLVFDGALARSGLATYAATGPVVPAPAWILAIWAAFALTLDASLAFLQRRLLLAALLGAVGGPAAYLGAARGWGAVTFSDPAAALLALAIGWALALPALLWLARRWTTPVPARPLPAGSTR
jgi:hypothetical protein